ncbi:MAG: hypothetical protein ACT4P6_09560 [Gemmatimonadaceae bacterium]
MKPPILFAFTTAAMALLGAWLLLGVFSEPRAVWTSAVLATVTQIASFGIARRYAATGDVIKGWGIGALVRVIVLVLYGLSSARLQLPLGPALMSFAAFVFASMLIEPLFLSR